MNRSDFLNAVSAVTAAVPLALGPHDPQKVIAGITIPDTSLARDADETARTALPTQIYNHSLRTFLFAELLAKAAKTDHDKEAVYVAALLHDTGLSPAHMSASNRFEIDSANLARNVLARHGVSGLRADLVWDAVALHDSALARWKQPEVQLVSSGVNVDFGAFLGKLDRNDIVSVLRAAPRTGFIPTFLDAVAVVARKKPFATGNCFVTDVGYKLVPGFHLDNFVDEVKTDPFDSFTDKA